ncbi:MAG: hypothetical protein CXR30_15885 [Geobacter sp.]|nr:MAG: hypothetical protein CXR30_15885 [Geobacter sp.]
MRCHMSQAKSACAKEIYREIETTPEEYLPALLEIVRGFRHGIFLKPADESFRQGMREALEGNTLPVSELWKGIDAR